MSHKKDTRLIWDRLDARLLSLSYNEMDLQLTIGDKILDVYEDHLKVRSMAS